MEIFPKLSQMCWNHVPYTFWKICKFCLIFQIRAIAQQKIFLVSFEVFEQGSKIYIGRVFLHGMQIIPHTVG